MSQCHFGLIFPQNSTCPTFLPSYFALSYLEATIILYSISRGLSIDLSLLIDCPSSITTSGADCSANYDAKFNGTSGGWPTFSTSKSSWSGSKSIAVGQGIAMAWVAQHIGILDYIQRDAFEMER